MAKQVKPETATFPKWYAAFVLTLYGTGGAEEKRWIWLSLGKMSPTAGRTSTVPPITTTSTTADWTRGYRIVEALRPCVRAPNGHMYAASEAFLEVRDTRMVGA